MKPSMVIYNVYRLAFTRSHIFTDPFVHLHVHR